MTTRQLHLSGNSQQRPIWPMRRLMAPKINCFYVHLAAAIPAEQHFGFVGRLSRRTDLRHYTFSYFYFLLLFLFFICYYFLFFLFLMVVIIINFRFCFYLVSFYFCDLFQDRWCSSSVEWLSRLIDVDLR